MSESLSLRPLRVPAGWTLRHNHLVDAPADHPLFEDFGTLLLAYHADGDLLLELVWNPRIEDTGRFLLRLFAGSQLGPSLHRFDSDDAAAIVAEAERLMNGVVAHGPVSGGERRYRHDDMVTLFHLCGALAERGFWSPQSDAPVADKAVALAPLLERFDNSLSGIDHERIGDFDRDFLLQVVDLFDWSSPESDDDRILLAKLSAKFRGGPA